MSVVPEPIFFPTVKRGEGAKRVLIALRNDENRDVTHEVTNLTGPEWIDIEGIQRGSKISFRKGEKKQFVVNLNTTHVFFPAASRVTDERVTLTLDDQWTLQIPITIQEIINREDVFNGVFSLDFGTTNSCYAWKARHLPGKDPSKLMGPAATSPEIPSLVFFTDVSHPTRPRYHVGVEAQHDIREASHRTYAYFMGVKRLLGMDRKFVVMDERAGFSPEHRREWSVEEIASFYVEALLRQAQADLGGSIKRVVATYPTLFSKSRREALKRVIEAAMQRLGVSVGPETVEVRLDEANSAAFNYIYGPMLDEFRSQAVRQRKAHLLAFDVGGGTIDVSLLDVQIVRDETHRITVNTELLGVTGEPFFAGDNVTLAAFKLLKEKIALEVARERAPKPAPKEPDVWAAASASKAKDDEEFDWNRIVPEEAKDRPPPWKSDDVDIENRDDPNAYAEAARTLLDHEEVLRLSWRTGLSLADAFDHWCRDAGRPTDRFLLQRIEGAIETLVPTRFARYQDADPFKEKAAREIFYELWQEAETMKVLLVGAVSGTGRVQGVLRRVAAYSQVDPKVLNDRVEGSLAELDLRVRPRLEAAVRKAHTLYRTALNVPAGDIVVRGETAEEKPLKVIVTGNGSKLPLVRRLIDEVFRLDETQVHYAPGRLKTAVAQGACEEEHLRREFGEAGLIRYASRDFLESLPYTVGLYNPELSLVGYEGGFCPVFKRGSPIGTRVVVDEKSNFLIHKKMTDLALYADYGDGAGPVYLGRVDLRKPGEAGGAPVDRSAATIVIRPVGETTAGAEASGFALALEVVKDRDIVVTNLGTGERYLMESSERFLPPEDNPFSGIH